MVSYDPAEQMPDTEDTSELVTIVDDIIKLIGERKYYWAGIALCDLRERLKNGQ